MKKSALLFLVKITIIVIGVLCLALAQSFDSGFLNFLGILLFIIFGCIYKIRAKEKVIDGFIVEVYAGRYNYYLKVNGEIEDHFYLHRRSENYRHYLKMGINLIATLPNSQNIVAKITSLKFISIRKTDNVDDVEHHVV